MQYKEVRELIKEITESYKGNLFFGSGTSNDLNTGVKDYPLTWMLRPLTVTNSITESSNTSQSFNLTLLFLQSGSQNSTEDEITDFFNETLNIANGFISTLIARFDSEGFETITVGNLTQINKGRDAIQFGWAVPIVIGSFVDFNLCCSPYED